MGLHKFSLLFAVLPQHLQMNLGLDVNFLTLSKSNLCAGCVNWHILLGGMLLQPQTQSLVQHSFAINYNIRGHFRYPDFAEQVLYELIDFEFCLRYDYTI